MKHLFYFFIFLFLLFSCAKIEYTVEIKPVKASPEISREITEDVNNYFRSEIRAIRKLKKVGSNAQKIIESDLYISGDKTHLDVRLIDSKTNLTEYENRRFWKKPTIYDLRFLVKKIFVDMEMNHFKWNRGLMK